MFVNASTESSAGDRLPTTGPRTCLELDRGNEDSFIVSPLGGVGAKSPTNTTTCDDYQSFLGYLFKRGTPRLQTH